jgi:hypothetical protein
MLSVPWRSSALQSKSDERQGRESKECEMSLADTLLAVCRQAEGADDVKLDGRHFLVRRMRKKLK